MPRSTTRRNPGRRAGTARRNGPGQTGHSAAAAAFGTEAPYLRQLGMDALVFGPGGIAQAHQPDEFIELSSIAPTVDVLRGLIREFCL